MLIENIRLAIRSLGANKMRAALTMLGITIGVGAVITLMSVGQGVSRYIASQFEGLGTNLLFVFPGEFRPGSGPPGRATTAVLTQADVLALADPARVPEAAYIVPVVGRTVLATARDSASNAPVRGTSPDYVSARNYQVLAGRFITEGDMDERARVVVIGQTTLNHLFAPDEEALGATIRLNGTPFRIVGILEKKGASPFGDDDDTIIIPYPTAVRLFQARTARGEPRVNLILAQAIDPTRQDVLIQQISEVLRDQHGIPYRGDDDFTILSQQDLMSAFEQVTSVLTIFLGAIAGIALVVGGIGIMNIMLVTVSERTKEIGLRKAVGAKRGHVLTQFLIESVVLSLLGGLLGIVVGALGSWGIRQAVPELDTTITLQSVLLATGFSAVVGLFFGLYPAWRASALRPIEALRYE